MASFSNVHWFSVKIKVSDWVERNFFSLRVFGGNLLAHDVDSSMTMDRHVQEWKWIGSIYLLTWGLLWASACSLEACGSILGFLLLQSLFFNKVAKLRPATLLKKRLWHRRFLVNFAKFLRTPSLQNIFGRLLLKITAASTWRFL